MGISYTLLKYGNFELSIDKDAEVDNYCLSLGTGFQGKDANSVNIEMNGLKRKDLLVIGSHLLAIANGTIDLEHLAGEPGAERPR